MNANGDTRKGRAQTRVEVKRRKCAQKAIKRSRDEKSSVGGVKVKGWTRLDLSFGEKRSSHRKAIFLKLREVKRKKKEERVQVKNFYHGKSYCKSPP